MRHSLVASLFALVTTAAGAAPAVAQVCTAIDESKDNLSPDERKAAMTFLGQALANNGQTVVPSGCGATYLAYHVRFGTSVTVHLSGPQGQRQATARSLEDVPPLYSQMVRSLLTGQPMSGANTTVDRTNVTQAQQAPSRVEADSLWYGRIGYGSLLAGSFSGGPAFGFGYRYELDTIGIDASFFNMIVPTSNDSSTDFKLTGSFVKLMGLYFLNPIANASAYFGGGLSWAGGGFTSNSRAFTGSGLQGELSAGYELLRASSIRMFIQLDAGLPFFPYTGETLVSGGTSDSKWGPIFALSFGVGWGRARTLTVRTIH